MSSGKVCVMPFSSTEQTEPVVGCPATLMTDGYGRRDAQRSGSRSGPCCRSAPRR